MTTALRSITILLLSFILSSHEFWIEPSKFFYERGELINMRFMVGENFEGDNWIGNRSRIAGMRFYFGGLSDTCRQFVGTEPGDSLQLRLYDEGTAMLTMQTFNSFIELDAENFHSYLEEDGLYDIIQYRKEHGDTLKPGREFYQRSIKTIIQVGDDRDRTYKQRTNLPIDIIPDDHPYHLAKDDNFKVKIYFRNEPLKHHKVKVFHRQNDRTTIQELQTDDDGEVKFFCTPSGKWLVSTVKMVRVEKDTTAEWQSYWGSLSFGYY